MRSPDRRKRVKLLCEARFLLDSLLSGSQRAAGRLHHGLGQELRGFLAIATLLEASKCWVSSRRQSGRLCYLFEAFKGAIQDVKRLSTLKI